MALARFVFQACSFNHSDISPYRINDFQLRQTPISPNCVRPWNILRSLARISSIAAEPQSDGDGSDLGAIAGRPGEPRLGGTQVRYAVEGGGLKAGVSSACVFSPPPFKLRFDASYSKRVPVAVEQPVLYTSPFRR